MTDTTTLPSDARPLPTVVGQTKKALDAFLEHVLIGSPFHGHDEWVYANVVAAGVLDDAVGAAVGAGPERIAEVQDALMARGLMSTPREFTEVGSAELAATRLVVNGAIAQLTTDIPQEDQSTVRRALDILRGNALAVVRAE